MRRFWESAYLQFASSLHRVAEVIDTTGLHVRLLFECMTTNWADTSAKHTLVGRARCRLVRRACRYIIYGWPGRVVSSALEGYLDLNH